MKIHDINIGGLYSLPFDCYVSGYDDPKNDLYSKSVFTMPANTLFVILEKVKVQATSDLYRIKILTARSRIGYISHIDDASYNNNNKFNKAY